MQVLVIAVVWTFCSCSLNIAEPVYHYGFASIVVLVSTTNSQYSNQVKLQRSIAARVMDQFYTAVYATPEKGKIMVHRHSKPFQRTRTSSAFYYC